MINANDETNARAADARARGVCLQPRARINARTRGNVVEFQKWGGSSGGDYRPRLTVKLSLMVPSSDGLDDLCFHLPDYLLNHIFRGSVIVWVENAHRQRK